MIYLQVGALFCKLVNPTSKRSGTCKDRRSADKALRLQGLFSGLQGLYPVPEAADQGPW